MCVGASEVNGAAVVLSVCATFDKHSLSLSFFFFFFFLFSSFVFSLTLNALFTKPAMFTPLFEPLLPIKVIDEAIAGRCESLIKVCTQTIFEYIRRGLFERDKLTIATKLGLSILLKEGKIESQKMRFVVYGGEVDGVARPDAIEWLPEACWRRVKALEAFKETFGELIPNMTEDPDPWRLWFDDPFPEQKQ